MISTEPKIMEKFVLKIHSYQEQMSDEKFEELLSLKRHFMSSKIIFLENDESKLVEVAKRFGKWLKNLKLTYDDWTAETAVKIFENMPELEELEIYSRDRKVADLSTGLVLLKNLKKLHGDWNVLTLIEAPMLEELNAFGQTSDLNSTKIEEFLKVSPKLQTLKVDHNFLADLGHSLPFRLKILETNGGYFHLSDNIKRFLLSQAATLKTLEANSDDSEFLEIVFTKFKQLKKLTTDFSTLMASDEFYENLEPMPLLKEITSLNGFSSETAMKAVLKNCPELEKLEIFGNTLSHDHLELIASHNKKLKFLSTSSIGHSSATFQHLQSLELTNVKNADHLLAFLKQNPTVEILVVRNQFDLRDKINFLIDLISETNLKQATIRSQKDDEVCNSIMGRFETSKKITLEITWNQQLRAYFLQMLRQDS